MKNRPMKSKRAILVGVMVLAIITPPAFGFDLGGLSKIFTSGVKLLNKDDKDESEDSDSGGGGLFGGGSGGLFGGDGIFSTGGFNPNAGGGDDDDDDSGFNPSFGGIDLDSLTKKDRTKEDDIDLFTKSTDLLLDKTVGVDGSDYTSAFGSLLKYLSKKSAKKTGDALIGGEGQDDLLAGGEEEEDGLLSDIGNLLEKSEDIVGAIGVLIPNKVGDIAKESQFLGEGGGIFGLNPSIVDKYMTEMAETEAISQSIDSMFSEEGQAITAGLQASVEESSFHSASIADQAQSMTASLDVSKAMAGQLSVLSTNQNAAYAEALQHRLATTQGNQLAAKLLKIEHEREWNDDFENHTRLASTFKSAASFASLVSPNPDAFDSDAENLPVLSASE